MIDLREDVTPPEEVEETELPGGQVPGKEDEDSTVLDENAETLNRHELELSLTKGLIDSLMEEAKGGFTPIGGIIAYSGTEPDIPDTWQLCNGQRNTPDLRDTFIMGSSMSNIGDTGGSTDIDQTLPEHTHQLDHHYHVVDGHKHTITHTHSINHGHSFSGTHVHSVGAHSHDMSHGHSVSVVDAGYLPSTYLHLRQMGSPWYLNVKLDNGTNEMLTANDGAIAPMPVTIEPHGHTATASSISGGTGSGGGGSTGSGGGGSVDNHTGSSGGSSASDTGNNGEANTQVAGAGDTYPAGKNESGQGKNLPPYMKLAYIQRIS